MTLARRGLLIEPALVAGAFAAHKNFLPSFFRNRKASLMWRGHDVGLMSEYLYRSGGHRRAVGVQGRGQGADA